MRSQVFPQQFTFGTMKQALAILRPFIAFVVLSLGTFFMLTMIIDYASLRTDIHFLQQKQEYLTNPGWKTAFYIHVFSSILALAAGFTQFSNYILTKHKRLHRAIGKMYVANILFINAPAGMILAIYANGLLPGKMAFIILDCLWFYFTWRAYTAIRKKKIEEHKEFMIRSFALTFSAITLRTWKIILSTAFTWDPTMLYIAEAWMGFVPNLLFAEWLIRRNRRRSSSETVRKGD
jgi:uncharacterized membrane protein